MYRYALRIDVPATDVLVLLDALEGEPLELTARLGWETLARQLEETVISARFDAEERWLGLDHDLEILSTYLAAPISAVELSLPDADGDPAQAYGFRVLALRGEVVRVALDVTDPERALERGSEDVDKLTEQLPSLPRWAQSLLAPRLPQGA